MTYPYSYELYFFSIKFALFIYTKYIYSVNIGLNTDYNRKL